MFLPAVFVILLIGLRIFVYDCALNILSFPLFMHFVVWGFLIGRKCSGRTSSSSSSSIAFDLIVLKESPRKLILK
jgi:hypothetical protein